MTPPEPQPPSTTSARPPAGDGRTCICDGKRFVWRDEVPGYPDGAMVRCRACQLRDIQAGLDALSGLLPSERQVTLDQIAPNGPDTARILAMARRFCEQPWGFWTLWGGYGNGKTLVLQAIVNHFRRQGQLAIYVRFHDLLNHIREGHAPGAEASARERYERLRDVRVLAIDELDKARLTEYAEEFRSAFLDDRHRYAGEGDPAVQRHTLWAMNTDPAELPDHIYDRLRDGRFGCELEGEPGPDGEAGPVHPYGAGPDHAIGAGPDHAIGAGPDHAIGAGWQPGITHNGDPSMRPAMQRE